MSVTMRLMQLSFTVGSHARSHLAVTAPGTAEWRHSVDCTYGGTWSGVFLQTNVQKEPLANQ